MYRMRILKYIVKSGGGGGKNCLFNTKNVNKEAKKNVGGSWLKPRRCVIGPDEINGGGKIIIILCR